MSSAATRQKEIGRLLALSTLRYAEREVSKAYWAKERALMLIRHPQYHTAIVHDLRGTPPVGVIWIRPSTGGKWGKSRREKFGSPDRLLQAARAKKTTLTIRTLGDRFAYFRSRQRVAALLAAGFSVSTNGCGQGQYFVGHATYLNHGRIFAASVAHHMFTGGAPTVAEAHAALLAVQAESLARVEAWRAEELARNQREMADYIAKTAIPAGRVIFTGEGGFRVGTN